MPTERTSNSDRQENEVEIVSQSTQDKQSRAFAHRDLNILISLLSLTLVALFACERRWRSICHTLARFTLVGRVGRRRRSSIERHLRIAFPGNDGSFDAVCRDFEAHQLEVRLQILRNLFRHDWQPQVSIRAVSHVEAALAAGRGAILWISRFAFADTIGKFGLHKAGYPLVHLSRSVHGSSVTRFGQCWLNPSTSASRIAISLSGSCFQDRAPAVALRRLHKVPATNGVVSIRILPIFVVQNAETGRCDLLIDEPPGHRIGSAPGSPLLCSFRLRS